MRIPRPVLRIAQALVFSWAVSCEGTSDLGVPSHDEILDDGWKAFRVQEYLTRVSQSLTVWRRTVVGPAIVDDVWLEGGKHGLTYCISNGFGSAKKEMVKAAVEIAAESWSRRVGVTFRDLTSDDLNCEFDPLEAIRPVRFTIKPTPAGESSSYDALAFSPSYLPENQVLKLGPSAFTPSVGGGSLEALLRHELGHVLGFRHEHMWAIPTEACSAEYLEGEESGEPGPEDDARLLVGGYDAESVMHYPKCRPPGSGLGDAQTETDYRAAISIYGLAPSLIVSAVTPL